MKMKVYDNVIPIYDFEIPGLPIETLLEYLDIMLEFHNVPHAFSIPPTSEIEDADEAGDTLCYWLLFEEKYALDVRLVFGLFEKRWLGEESDAIAGRLARYMAFHYPQPKSEAKEEPSHLES
jgi:hypothetical protein